MHGTPEHRVEFTRLLTESPGYSPLALPLEFQSELQVGSHAVDDAAGHFRRAGAAIGLTQLLLRVDPAMDGADDFAEPRGPIGRARSELQSVLDQKHLKRHRKGFDALLDVVLPLLECGDTPFQFRRHDPSFRLPQVTPVACRVHAAGDPYLRDLTGAS